MAQPTVVGKLSNCEDLIIKQVLDGLTACAQEVLTSSTGTVPFASIQVQARGAAVDSRNVAVVENVWETSNYMMKAALGVVAVGLMIVGGAVLARYLYHRRAPRDDRDLLAHLPFPTRSNPTCEILPAIGYGDR